MKKRIGIAALVIGVLIALVAFVSPTAPPVVSSPPPVAVATPSTNLPVPVVAVATVPTNPPVAPPPPAPVETNAPETNPPPVVAIVPAPETNPPPVVPVVSIPETNPPPIVIESSGPPVNGVRCSMVRNLLTDVFTNNLTDSSEAFYRIRAGYEYANLNGHQGTWWAGAKFYFRPQSWRDGLKEGTNVFASLLVPDFYAEIDHSAIPFTPTGGATVLADGVQVQAGFFWPWLNWRVKPAAGSDASELNFSIGPTAVGGVEEATSVSDFTMHWTRYGGVRLAASPDAFVEFTVGRSDDLGGFRRQLVGEIPIYRKARSDFRYVVRGLWNTSSSQNADIYEVALLVEFPFEALEHPSSFRDLIPFIK
jgi:hypothetical protein